MVERGVVKGAGERWKLKEMDEESVMVKSKKKMVFRAKSLGWAQSAHVPGFDNLEIKNVDAVRLSTKALVTFH